MFSLNISVGIGSKSHVLVMDVRTVRVMYSLLAGVKSLNCACTPALDRCSTTSCSVLESCSMYVSHFGGEKRVKSLSDSRIIR